LLAGNQAVQNVIIDVDETGNPVSLRGEIRQECRGSLMEGTLTATPSPVVALIDITKRYGSFTANDAVNLTLHAGEIHALLGENGAGKSTLMKVLNGLVQPDGGKIVVKGQEIRPRSPADARSHGIGMVFQHFSLFEGLTALENIALGLDGMIAGDALRGRLTHLEAQYGLKVAPDALVSTLSAGERQRIELVRVLLMNPDVLILDEPTSVLTPQESDALFRLVRKLADGGTSVLFISHKLEEVRALCSTATILRLGKRVAVVDPRQETAKSLAALLVGEGVGDVQRPATVPGAVLLAAKDLSASAATVHATAIKHIRFELRVGEILGIAGIAGHGQSEVFALLSGEMRATSGALVFGTVDITTFPINVRRAMGCAFVPEERLGHAAVPGRPLSDNMALSPHSRAGALSVLKKGILRSAAEAVVKRFDVRVPRADPKARQLSGGNLQKFVVGRELAKKPKLLVVNQPTWGVDAKAAQLIRQSLVEHARSGAAIVMISQDLDEVFEISDRIAVLREGQLTPVTPVQETSRNAIGLLMTGGDDALWSAA
jgi:general nucleoside transport system ATP-binding protein